MNRLGKSILTGLLVILATAVIYASFAYRSGPEIPEGREEVVFWHFWGGADRKIVEEVVRRFNTSQQQYFVRAIAMPGNNLDVKLFLSVTGGDPPDLINQDDPIIADWASRDALTPLSELASSQEQEQEKRSKEQENGSRNNEQEQYQKQQRGAGPGPGA